MINTLSERLTKWISVYRSRTLHKRAHLERRRGVEGVKLQTTSDGPDAVGRVLRRGGPWGGEPGRSIYNRKEHRGEELVESHHFRTTRGMRTVLRMVCGFYGESYAYTAWPAR